MLFANLCSCVVFMLEVVRRARGTESNGEYPGCYEKGTVASSRVSEQETLTNMALA